MNLPEPSTAGASLHGMSPQGQLAEPLAVALDLDPFDRDHDDDLQLITTERRLRRLLIIAADTGARFEREGIDCDPVAWLLAPRVLFEGERAIDACQNGREFARAIVLHGLSLGLDADPAGIDALLSDPAMAGSSDGALDAPLSEKPSASTGRVRPEKCNKQRSVAPSRGSVRPVAGGA